MTKKTIKYFTIIRSDNGKKVEVDADFFRIDAGIYMFYQHDADYIPRKVHQISMIYVKELSSNYREEDE